MAVAGPRSSIGAPAAILTSGGVCLISALFYFSKLPVIRDMVRPIYRGKGILPQIAGGVEQAAHPTVKSGDY